MVFTTTKQEGNRTTKGDKETETNQTQQTTNDNKEKRHKQERQGYNKTYT